MPPRKTKEQEDKEAAERARVEQERRAGDAALQQARVDDAAKTDEQRAAEEEQARKEQEEREAKERARVEEEQRAANEELERLRIQVEAEQLDDGDERSERMTKALAELSPDARLLKKGTVLFLNGERCVLPLDLPVVLAGASDEQHFASILARDPENHSLNADLLRLVYNPMNGTPLPLSSQRLKLEDMTDQERSLFDAPPLPPRRR